MAFFKFRMPGQASAAQAAAAENAASESAEVLRQRARHRLLGAAVLVVLAVIGFPFLFDTQPRTVSVDIAVEIPDKNKARSPVSPVEAAPSAVANPVPLAPDQGLSAKEEVVAPTTATVAKSAPVATVAPAPPVAPAPSVAPAPKTESAKTEPEKPSLAESKEGAARQFTCQGRDPGDQCLPAVACCASEERQLAQIPRRNRKPRASPALERARSA